jgi:predicted nucleic acid-binding protein
MNPDCFLDTNVLFYAAMGRFSTPQKYRRARQVMAETNFAVSGQVLQEFYVNVTKKSDKPLTTEQAIQWVNRLIDRPCAAIDHDLVVRGAEIARRYKISYWDGSIVEGAERVRAPILCTEDLNDGQFYGSVRVLNPFKTH